VWVQVQGIEGESVRKGLEWWQCFLLGYLAIKVTSLVAFVVVAALLGGACLL